jgi:hypothetical protein
MRSIWRAICLPLAPFVAILLIALGVFAPSASAQHSVYLYVCKPSPFGAGHAFLGFKPSTGPQAGVERKVGLYPGESGAKGALNSPGQIRNDDTHDWDHRICYNVNASTYNSIAGSVNADIAGGITYQLCPGQTPGPGTNCAGWAVGKLRAAGLCGVPSPTNKLGYPDPYALGCLLKDMAAAGIQPVCGVLEQSILFPTLQLVGYLGEGGYSGFCSWGHGDAVGLSNALYQPVAQSTVPQLSLRVGNVLQLTVGNINPEAITSVEWGDGSEFEYSGTDTYSHSYTTPGIRTISLVIITDGSVQRVTRTVRVSAATGGSPLITLWNYNAPFYPDVVPFAFPPEYVAFFDSAL